MTQKDVTGVICLPLPPLDRGRHTLSCVYTDGKYNTKNRCFQIQVVSATPVIHAGDGEEGRPNTTVHFVVQVTNEQGVPVQDGQVKMYYNSTQDNWWAEEAKEAQGVSVEIDSANIVVDGRVTLDYTIPNNFRAGNVNLRFRYDLSHEGYDPISVVIPVYVYRDGDLQLSYSYGSSVNNTTPVDEFYNVPPNTKCFCTATLYDGTDENKTPIKDVPINFKMGTDLTSPNPFGTIGNATTNNQGSCTVATPTISDTLTQFILKVKNEAQRIVGTIEKTQTLRVAKTATIITCSVRTDYSTSTNKMGLSVTVVAENENHTLLSGRPVIIKLNDMSVPQNGDFADPNDTLTVNTNSNGSATLSWENLYLSPNNTYSLEINVGGGNHIIGAKKNVGTISWTNGTKRYELVNNQLVEQ